MNRILRGTFPPMKRLFTKKISILFFLIFSACTIDRPEKHYILAERLWADEKYSEAVREFDKVTQKDPRGRLGLQALFRSAMTDTLFLSEHLRAIQKLKLYIDQSRSEEMIWEANKQIGEIFYTSLQHYGPAAEHYQALFEKPKKIPEAERGPLIFRLAKSLFYSGKFQEATVAYRLILKDYPNTPLAEKASFEIGVCHFTRGEQQPGGPEFTGAYREAISAYEEFLAKYPKSALAVQARFGIAGALEELDRLDEAFAKYHELKNLYPQPQVIQIKLIRIRERIAQRDQ